MTKGEKVIATPRLIALLLNIMSFGRDIAIVAIITGSTSTGSSMRLQSKGRIKNREDHMQGDGSIAYDPLLREILDRLVDAYKPLRVYLFGSRARHDSGADSDYDLLVVVPDDADPSRKRSRLAYEVLWTTGAAVDVIVWTKSRFEERLSVKASLSATVAREGRLLYAA